jgi:hypothetical protein
MYMCRLKVGKTGLFAKEDGIGNEQRRVWKAACRIATLHQKEPVNPK